MQRSPEQQLTDARRVIEAALVAFVHLGDADDPVTATWSIIARRWLAGEPLEQTAAPAPAGMSDDDDVAADVLHDILGLVMERPPSVLVIGYWTPAEREAARAWASACHLQASDNDVVVPPRPHCLDYTFAVSPPQTKSGERCPACRRKNRTLRTGCPTPSCNATVKGPRDA